MYVAYLWGVSAQKSCTSSREATQWWVCERVWSEIMFGSSYSHVRAPFFAPSVVLKVATSNSYVNHIDFLRRVSGGLNPGGTFAPRQL